MRRREGFGRDDGEIPSLLALLLIAGVCPLKGLATPGYTRWVEISRFRKELSRCQLERLLRGHDGVAERPCSEVTYHVQPECCTVVSSRQCNSQVEQAALWFPSPSVSGREQRNGGLL